MSETSEIKEISDIFDTSGTFADLGLNAEVLRGIEDSGFVHPTDIQARMIPQAMAGKDVLGQAKTGTGKTAAFGLPTLHRCDPKVSMQVLVLAPTRELAVQVAAELDEMGKHTAIRTTCMIGGESMRHQTKSLKNGGHIIVGTPGRVMDMQGRGEISFNGIKIVILDEVDRMLDIGFREDIRKILKSMKQDHQTLFVSATISPEVERLARSFMKKDAQKIMTTSGSLTVSLVDQTHIPVEAWDKRTMLLHLLRKHKPEAVVVFCRTKATVHRVTEYLRGKDIHAREIHGDMAQNKRTKVMNTLREGNLPVLVASDLAARGLDVDHITHVINYDLPEDPEVYVHRIGRTARAGRRGVGWSFVTPDQGQLLTEIEKLTGVELEKFEVEGFKPGPVPQSVRSDRDRSSRKSVMDPKEKMKQRAAVTGATDGMSKEELKKMFPGGVVPKNAPRRTLGSKFRTRRGR